MNPIAFLAALSLGGAATAHAEDAPTADYREVELVDEGPARLPDRRAYRSMFVLSPMLIPPGVELHMHRELTDRTSLVVGVGGAAWRVEGEGPVRFKLLAGLDLNPAGNGMAGFLISPRVSWGQLIIDEGDADDRTNMLTAGLLLGHRWIMTPGTTVSIAAGPAYNHWSQEGDSLLDVLAPTVEFTFGWAL